MAAERIDTRKNQVIAFTSGKGGAGKSTLCAGLGTAFGQEGEPVLVIDLDVGLRGVDLLLGAADQVVFDLGDLLEGRCTIGKAIVPSPLCGNLSLIAAPMALDAPISPRDMRILLDSLRPHFGRILLDMPAGLVFSSKMAASTADLALIVATPDPVCIRDGCAMVHGLLREGFENHRLVINRADPKVLGRGPVADLDQVIDGVGSQLIGVLPEASFPLEEGALFGRVCQAISRRIDGEYLPLLLR